MGEGGQPRRESRFKRLRDEVGFQEKGVWTPLSSLTFHPKDPHPAVPELPAGHFLIHPAASEVKGNDETGPPSALPRGGGMERGGLLPLGRRTDQLSFFLLVFFPPGGQ